MDKVAWQATVHGVTKSWTRLSNQYYFYMNILHFISLSVDGPLSYFHS